ncbi:MAG: patatin-like phospholipase family protein [Chitinophagales bacterium]
MVKVGIALSGGGARGMTHAGVLKALEEFGVEPQIISGASAGSIVGALYAYGYSPDEMLKMTKGSNMFKVIRKSGKIGMNMEPHYMRHLIKEAIPEDDFAALKKKLYVAVTNITTGKSEIISKGQLSEVIAASSAIPIIFKPVEMNDCLYVDGGLLNNLPVEPIKNHCKVLLGSNVVPHGVANLNRNRLRDIIGRTKEMIVWNSTENQLLQCDIVIEAPEVFEMSMFHFRSAKRFFDLGYQQTLTQMDNILREITKKNS